MTAPSAARERFGYCCIMGLFVAWAPLVLFICGSMSLDSLQWAVPSVAGWRATLPMLSAIVGGTLPTLGLNGLMACLPSIFLIIVKGFFRPIAWTHAQLLLQQLYFAFLLVFVLLVTALSQGLITTLVFVAAHPTAVIPLLAKSLPLSSHFYLSYMVLCWFSSTLELLRVFPLLRFLSLKAFMEPELARQCSEEQSVLVGPRVSESAMMMVITLVFCSLSPVILAFAWVYFAVSRVVHGYLCCFAEPPQADSGGVFWVHALKHVQVGLFVYVLLMLGVIGAHSVFPFLVVLPALPYLALTWGRFDEDFAWTCLPLDKVEAAEDEAEQPSEGMYVQPECKIDASPWDASASRGHCCDEVVDQPEVTAGARSD